MAIINRTANLQVTEAFIRTIHQQQYALEQTRQEISSGLRVANPSDDPGRAGSISQLQRSLIAFDRYRERTSYAQNILDQQEQVLNSTEGILTRARELATQGANETLGSDKRELLAAEVFELRDSLVTLANTRIQGRYIYGGGEDENPPFILDDYTNPASTSDPAHDRYVFDAGAGRSITRSVQISESVSVQVNSPGDQVFERAISAVERLGRALAGYRTDPEDLSGLPDGGGAAFVFPDEFTEQTDAIRALIDEVEAARSEDIVVERTQVGSRLARVDETRNLNEQLRINVEESRSAFQDADIVEAASRFSALQISLEGALQTGATINRLSLLDFL